MPQVDYFWKNIFKQGCEVLLLQSPKKIVPLFLACFLLSGCADERIITRPSGLSYIDNEPGSGKRARIGDSVTVHFKAWLVKDLKNPFCENKEDSTAVMLGDTYSGGIPIEFKLENNNFIKGSEEGIRGMRKGGMRTIIIPSWVLYKNAPGDFRPDMVEGVKLIVEMLKINKRKNITNNF